MDLSLFKDLVKKTEKQLNVNLNYEFELCESKDIFVSLSGNKVILKGKEISDFARGLMLLSVKLKEGKKQFEISEKRRFENLGFSIDLSRNAVITVPVMKEIIDVISLMGFNVLKLYMEDVFDLPGFPHFGYRRGKYSHSELKEIDEYAFNHGIEVIPSIQTLGHLSQYLRYAETSEFRENSDVLLCGEEKTYKFIDAMLKTMRDCFKTKRIVINCDEAQGVGVKRIMGDKKYVSPYDITMKHLDKILEICRKYNFKPCVHGDLFYGHLGKGYYDFDFAAKKDDIEKIPDVDVVYWDYYHTGYEDYETLLKGHRSLGKDVIFMGGVWIWAGQLPNAKFTLGTMEPALKCCLENKVKDVWAATFGDDGNETNIAFALPQLLIFSEYCFKGKKNTKEWMENLFEKIFGIDMDFFLSVSDYHYPFVEGLSKEDYIFPNNAGKKIFYTDIFYNMTGTYDFSKYLIKHKEAYEKIKNADISPLWKEYFEYAKLIFEITIKKMELIPKIKSAYQNKNTEKLLEISEKEISALFNKYEVLMLMHEKQWLSTYKPFGWEELNGRYANTMERLKYAERTIKRFADKEINSIPELDYEYIEETENVYNFGKNVALYKNLKSTGI